MRIGIYTPAYPGDGVASGIGTYTRHLAQGLSALGHEMHVLVPGGAASPVRDGSVHVHFSRTDHLPGVDRLLPGAGAVYRTARAMARLTRRYELDLVEFPNWEGLGLLYCFFRRSPVVVRLHTSTVESVKIDGRPPTRMRAWDIRRERWLARTADRLVTHSTAHRNNVAAEIGIDPNLIAIVPHGVPVFPTFQRLPKADDHLKVVYLGRMERRKGVQYLIEALPEVLRQFPRAQFTFIGDDRTDCPGGQTHVDYANRLLAPELLGRVEFTGGLPDDEVNLRLQTADIFVAPSLYESFGLIFLEAMRWGTPVVGTDVGGIPEIIDDGVTGLLVPPRDPVRLAEALCSLLGNADLRRRIGEAGRLKVESRFTVRTMAEQALELYESTRQAAGAARGDQHRGA